MIFLAGPISKSRGLKPGNLNILLLCVPVRKLHRVCPIKIGFQIFGGLDFEMISFPNHTYDSILLGSLFRAIKNLSFGGGFCCIIILFQDEGEYMAKK